MRLEHMVTERNLHSHKFKSPVSGRQEVSGFGENGEGDDGDNWYIQCKDKLDGDYIDGKTEFHLKHANSGQFLYTDSGSLFTQQNCRNCRIIGQAEVSGTVSKNHKGLWRFVSGYFFAQDKDGDYGLGDIVEEDLEEDYHTDDL